jgi:hypothetical protein
MFHGTDALTTWARDAHLIWESKPVTAIIIITSTCTPKHRCRTGLHAGDLT